MSRSPSRSTTRSRACRRWGRIGRRGRPISDARASPSHPHLPLPCAFTRSRSGVVRKSRSSAPQGRKHDCARQSWARGGALCDAALQTFPLQPTLGALARSRRTTHVVVGRVAAGLVIARVDGDHAAVPAAAARSCRVPSSFMKRRNCYCRGGARISKAAALRIALLLQLTLRLYRNGSRYAKSCISHRGHEARSVPRSL